MRKTYQSKFSFYNIVNCLLKFALFFWSASFWELLCMWGSQGLKWFIKGFFMKLLQKSSGGLTKQCAYSRVLSGDFQKAFKHTGGYLVDGRPPHSAGTVASCSSQSHSPGCCSSTRPIAWLHQPTPPWKFRFSPKQTQWPWVFLALEEVSLNIIGWTLVSRKHFPSADALGICLLIDSHGGVG